LGNWAISDQSYLSCQVSEFSMLSSIRILAEVVGLEPLLAGVFERALAGERSSAPMRLCRYEVKRFGWEKE